MTDETTGYEAQFMLHEWTFFLAWSYPGEPIPLDSRAQQTAEHFPAQILREGDLVNPRLVPRIRDQDWNLKSMLHDARLQGLHDRIRPRLKG
jgi:hypothetical protein